MRGVVVEDEAMRRGLVLGGVTALDQVYALVRIMSWSPKPNLQGTLTPKTQPPSFHLGVVIPC
jgi:hypothetical protein